MYVTDMATCMAQIHRLSIIIQPVGRKRHAFDTKNSHISINDIHKTKRKGRRNKRQRETKQRRFWNYSTPTYFSKLWDTWPNLLMARDSITGQGPLAWGWRRCQGEKQKTSAPFSRRKFAIREVSGVCLPPPGLGFSWPIPRREVHWAMGPGSGMFADGSWPAIATNLISCHQHVPDSGTEPHAQRHCLSCLRLAWRSEQMGTRPRCQENSMCIVSVV